MQIAQERPIFSLFLTFFSRQVDEVRVDKKSTEINEYSPERDPPKRYGRTVRAS